MRDAVRLRANSTPANPIATSSTMDRHKNKRNPVSLAELQQITKAVQSAASAQKVLDTLPQKTNTTSKNQSNYCPVINDRIIPQWCPHRLKW